MPRTSITKCLLSVSVAAMMVLVAPSFVSGDVGSPPGQSLQARAAEPRGATDSAAGLTVQQWAERVWASASRGDRGALNQFGAAIPPELTGDHVQHIRESYARYRDNELTAATGREEKRTAAAAKMTELAAAGNLSQALVKAVELQSLSHDMDAVLRNPEVKGLMDQAVARIETAQTEGDLLQTQELLFRLRTLHEDTGQIKAYEGYKDRLEQVNRRVSLLAGYAPRHLHELAQQQAKRFGEEELKPFNANTANDWKERVKGVDHKMLWSALQQAAADHIESGGWEPLMVGGLSALRTLATTSDLSETFPALADRAKVDQWVMFIDGELLALQREGQTETQLRRRCQRLLYDDLPLTNKRTVNLPDTVMYHEFGDGAMTALDDFSEIIWPGKLRRFRQSTEGHFVGVGILIRHDDQRKIQVVNPLEGTPAYFAGVKPDDRIEEVDDQSTVGWSLNDAVDKITGRAGSPVSLGLRRQGVDDLIHITLIRKEIRMPSVNGWWKTRLDADGRPEWDFWIDRFSRIAYIKLTEFSEDSPRDLHAAWDQISRTARPNGLILDLRFNPGGLLSSAVEISNLFLKQGLIVKGEDKDQEEQWRHKAEANKADIAKYDVPLIILINKGSASASEIVAGCLQAYGKALIIGDRSYGKGSVQTVRPLGDGGGEPDAAIKLTTQYYRLPPKGDEEEGRLVHKRPGATQWGVDPDLHVEMTPDQILASLELRQSADIIDKDAADPAAVHGKRPDVNDLLSKGIDPQLETALLLLQVRALGSSDVRQARLDRPPMAN